MLHTILGAGGSVGNALAYELINSQKKVRLVSRSNFTISGAESYKADLTSYPEALASLKDTDFAFLCVGLPYDSKIWDKVWHIIMQNIIDACKTTGTKLIFFDNVYMYGKVNGEMTEDTPYNPCSRKGEVRAKIALLLEEEIKKKNINAIIARSADLYGPYITDRSVPYFLVIDKLLKNKKPQWIVDPDKKHTYSYTIDCAKGMNMLSEDDACYNQVWHLPTCNSEINGRKFIEIASKELGVSPNFSILKKGLMKFAGLFNKRIYESIEMLYQFQFDYLFDSSKFEKYFNYKPISYYNGIQETIEFFKY